MSLPLRRRTEVDETARKKIAAGERHATKQITHRPSRNRANGLRARAKALVIVQQTEKQNKNGDINYVLEQEKNLESYCGVDGSSWPLGRRRWQGKRRLYLWHAHESQANSQQIKFLKGEYYV